MAFLILLVLGLYAWYKYDQVRPRELPPEPPKKYAPDFRLARAFWDWQVYLSREGSCGIYSCDYGEKWNTIYLTDGRTLRGHFEILKDDINMFNWKITGFKTLDGELFTGKKEIPMEAHIKAFVGALSQPNMSSSIEELTYSLAETGFVVADITKLNGIDQKRYMSEYFKDNMKRAWGDALIKVLEGAADKFTVDNEKPWLVTLYAPKELCS